MLAKMIKRHGPIKHKPNPTKEITKQPDTMQDTKNNMQRPAKQDGKDYHQSKFKSKKLNR
jgi:hypothetical protein